MTDTGMLSGKVSLVTGASRGVRPWLPLAVEILPMHLPLPAKIRTELLNPIELDKDPTQSEDDEYVSSIYREVEAAIQAGMDRLAKRRSFPIFG